MVGKNIFCHILQWCSFWFSWPMIIWILISENEVWCNLIKLYWFIRQNHHNCWTKLIKIGHSDAHPNYSRSHIWRVRSISNTIAKWTMSDMVKYRATLWSFLELTALVFYHVWHSPLLYGELRFVSNTFWTKIPQNSQSAKRAMAMTSEEAARLSRTFPSQLRFGNQSHCISHVVIKFDPVWASFIYFEPIWSILIKLDPIGSSLNKFDPVWTSLIKFWSSLNKFEQVLSSFIKFYPVWSIWIKFKPLWSSLRTCLNKFDPVWTSLNKFDKFDPIWSSLN